MTNLKLIVTGCVMAVLSAVGTAQANCDQGSFAAAQADADEGNARGDSCEVIELQNGTFEAQCDGQAFPTYVQACEGWVETALECDGLSADECDAAMGHMYDNCMVIAVHTGAVK